MSVQPGPVVILGSGETSPFSQKLYDWAMASFEPPVQVRVLETPAGFEPNTAHVAGRIAAFVDEHLAQHRPNCVVVPARQRGTPLSPDEPAAVAPLYQADLLLLGPGSPTYAVRQLRDSLAWHILQARHRLGAAVVLASAGAIAAGSSALPVYEIYKVGEDLHWQPGLDFFGAYGLNLVILPHWNNADGGAELDTSRCFMGLDRFRQLERLLPEQSVVVGLDEQTGLVVDFEAEVCRVWGQGTITLTVEGRERQFSSGQSFSVRALGSFRRPDLQAGLPAAVWEEAKAVQRSSHDTPPLDPRVSELVAARERLRAAHDWLGADQLRRQVRALGWHIDDTPDGPRLHPLPRDGEGRS